jgi:co-chaperonin GroES (HSP10)
VAPLQSAGGILLPDSGKKLNEGEVVAVGPGATAKDGKVLPMNVSVGDRVLLPEYGGHSVKIGEEECVPCARARATRRPPPPASLPICPLHLSFPPPPLCAPPGSFSFATRTSWASTSKRPPKAPLRTSPPPPTLQGAGC